MALLNPVQICQKKTKIVCTIGPSSSNEETLRGLIEAGADVFRLNFSHGSHGGHQQVIHTIRHISRDMNRPIPILGDLSGPKLRVGDVKGGGMPIQKGETLTFTSDDLADGSDARFHLDFNLWDFAKPGDEILLDDGAFKVIVEKVQDEEVVCRVQNSGILKSRKGVNLPDTDLPIPALTEKDKDDLAFAMRHGVDLIALSFVRKPQDILDTRAEMERLGRVVPLFAKIEKKEALENLEEIVRHANGAMVARGDLGIEIPMERVPGAQKQIIRMCNAACRPVIVATQMLESMIKAQRPTRAEVTDVHNAIHDGADAVMLSGETAVGDHPPLVVETMNIVAAEAERLMSWRQNLELIRGLDVEDGIDATLTNVVCNSAVAIAERMDVDMILVPTQTGYSARHVSMFRPRIPIFAVSPSETAVMAANLCWGVTARQMPELIEEEVEKSESDALVNEVIRTAKRYHAIKPGDRVVILGGIPIGASQHTNYLRVMEID